MGVHLRSFWTRRNDLTLNDFTLQSSLMAMALLHSLLWRAANKTRLDQLYTLCPNIRKSAHV